MKTMRALTQCCFISQQCCLSLNDLFGDDKARYYKYENIVKIKMTKMMLVIQLVPVLSRLFNNSLSTLGRTSTLPLLSYDDDDDDVDHDDDEDHY